MAFNVSGDDLPVRKHSHSNSTEPVGDGASPETTNKPMEHNLVNTTRKSEKIKTRTHENGN
jgi:hypothetical protein